jgi:hypothetical protein
MLQIDGWYSILPVGSAYWQFWPVTEPIIVTH